MAYINCMSAHVSLLKEDTHIIAPDTDSTKNIATYEIVKEKGRCEKCGKVLKFPYFLFVGIRPSSSIIEAIKCSNLNDERVGLESVIGVIRFEGKDFSIDPQHQWIFSDQNIMNSKTRLCVDCYEEYKGHFTKDILLAIRIREVFFAVTEYQRRHTPISSAKSESERYRISLPDRSMVHWTGFGINYGSWLDEDTNWGAEMDAIADFLRIALIPDYGTSLSMLNHDYANSILQELRADFIQDKNRLIPNDQELTKWMKKYYGNPSDHSWISAIEFCKVFTNPRTSHTGDYVLKANYSVFVHYIDNDWDEFYIWDEVK